MKKEIFAITMITVLLIAAFANILYLKKVTAEITAVVEQGVQAVKNENWDIAEDCAARAEKMWNEHDGYTHMVLRHSEIDTVSDALYDFMSDVYENNEKSAYVSAEKAIYHLDNIYRMEQIRPGSIF